MSRINSVAQRMRWLTAAVVLLGVQGCGDEGQKPGKTVDSCVSACADPGSNDVTDTTRPFVPSNFMAYTKINPTSSGRLEISGQTSADARFNGYYIDYSAGTVASGEYWLIMTPAVGTGLPSPNSGNLITASGVELLLIPVGDEYKENGDYNHADPAKPVEVLFKGFRGTVVNFNKVANQLEENVSFNMTPKGTVAHPSSFSAKYLVDKPAEMNATINAGAYAEFYVDFTGTKDEGTSDQLQFAVNAPAGATVSAITPNIFRVQLPIGQGQTVTATVSDQFGTQIAGQSYNLDVDPLLQSVDVACNDTVVPADANTQCNATAYWNTGTSVTLDPAGLGADTGNVSSTGVYSPQPTQSGSDRVTYSYGGKTGEQALTVAAVITGVTATCLQSNLGPEGTTSCDAEGYFNDGTSATMTGSATFSANFGSFSGNQYSASTTGAMSTNPEVDTVTANLEGYQDATDITVTAAPPDLTGVTVNCAPADITNSETADCTATAYWNSDFTGPFTENVSSSGSWSALTGTVSANGVYTPGAFDGTDTVRNTYLGKFGEFTVRVRRYLSGLLASCFPKNITTEESSQCKSVASYSDGTTADVSGAGTWTAMDGNSTVDGSGLLTPNPVSATALVSHDYTEDGISKTAYENVNISGVITGVTVSGPASVQVNTGGHDFDATAHWSHGATSSEDGNCSWSTNLTGSTVDGSGVYSAPASVASSPETDTVQCDLDGTLGSAAVEVTAPAPTVTNLVIDCVIGSCFAGGVDYTLSFGSLNATTYTVTVELVSGSGQLGTLTFDGNITSATETFSYNTGINSVPGDVIKFTIITTGSGGNTIQTLEVTLS